MTTLPKSKTDLFTRALTAAAVLAPILLIRHCGHPSDGFARRHDRRGRCVHPWRPAGGDSRCASCTAMGFSQARKLLRSGPNRSQTA